MATTTFQLHTPPLHGTVVINPNTGSALYTPNLGYTGTDSWTYDILCDGVIVDTALASGTIIGFCNDPFTIVAVKNNCTVGVPSSINYNVLAGVSCGYSTKAEANWAAYQLSLPLAQTQANLGTCNLCDFEPFPCILSYSLGRMTISGTPGHTFKIYKGNLLILSVVAPASGVVVLENDLLIGEIFVTQVSPLGVESQKNCLPFMLVDECYT